MFWHLGLSKLSLRAYNASLSARRKSVKETACIKYVHHCESGCSGHEVCTDAPARSLHDYEGLRNVT